MEPYAGDRLDNSTPCARSNGETAGGRPAKRRLHPISPGYVDRLAATRRRIGLGEHFFALLKEARLAFLASLAGDHA